MKVKDVSEFLENIKVWHKIEGNYIYTKRMRIKIPEITNSVAYLAGIITGDGSILTCKRKVGGHHYSIRLWGRKEKLMRLPTLLNDLFNYKTKILRDRRKRNCYCISIAAAAIYAYFVLLGLPVGKKRKLSVPWLIADNPLLFKHYLMGLIDTDGHVRKGRVQLKQRNKKFLKELVKLLEKHFGIKSNPPKVNFTKGKPYYYIRFPIGPMV